MNNQDWARLELMAAKYPTAVMLDRNELGTCVVMEGFGVFHPKNFLDLVDSCAQSALGAGR
jgi:hypothetical protein